jgi:hypothetical protein
MGCDTLEVGMGGLDGDLLGGNCFFSGLGVLMIMTEG